MIDSDARRFLDAVVKSAWVARTAVPPGFGRAVKPQRHLPVETSENLAMT